MVQQHCQEYNEGGRENENIILSRETKYAIARFYEQRKDDNRGFQECEDIASLIRIFMYTKGKLILLKRRLKLGSARDQNQNTTARELGGDIVSLKCSRQVLRSCIK